MNTHKYEGRHSVTQQILRQEFPSEQEAENFAEENIVEYPDYKITSIFSGVTGIIHEEADEEINDDYNEEDELRMMGLDDEETEAGFDWDKED